MKINIIIWDTEASRIADIDKNLHRAALSLGIKIVVTSNSEPPSLFRAGLYYKVPVLEIEGKYWECKNGTPSVSDCISLLGRIRGCQNA